MWGIVVFCLVFGLMEGKAHADSEAARNAEFCASVGGQTEVRHTYSYAGAFGVIVVDCETWDTVYEVGLDRRSSLDSLQQAVFAAALTGKEPAVVIFDTDGKIGPYEHRIRVGCEAVGVEFLRTLKEGEQ